MWPGLVGKEDGTSEPPISLDRMLELTRASDVGGQTFDGVDMFLFQPHLDIDAGEDEVKRLADQIAGIGLKIGSVVAPIWEGTVGGSSMGDAAARTRFVLAVEKACRYTKILREHGVREYGSIRIDSAAGVAEWSKDPVAGTKLIAETFKESARVAEDYDEVLVAEGEICWAGMHSWKDMLDLLEAVGMPDRLGFQADLAHTYLYLLGYNAEQHALLSAPYCEDEFWAAYQTMTDQLRPWTYDFHVAQNDGSVHGTGAHDKTGRHCKADDPNGRLDIVRCAGYWLLDDRGNPRPEIKHLCWDGCMFPNEDLEKQETWNTILSVMQDVNIAHG
ncbi:MAG: sugar phosphate isomerase/epimerase [Verrucomicrobiae bacterium]|nr:sugar phosphate isomerase/epimerase [Verrucomicrobiae bacterium]NNJ41734.1 TIM barrel protein [Akkermansiaceae bacterium]